MSNLYGSSLSALYTTLNPVPVIKMEGTTVGLNNLHPAIPVFGLMGAAWMASKCLSSHSHLGRKIFNLSVARTIAGTVMAAFAPLAQAAQGPVKGKVDLPEVDGYPANNVDQDNMKLHKTNRIVIDIPDRAIKKDVACFGVELAEEYIVYDQKLAKIVEKVLATPPALALLNKALADGPLIVFLADLEFAPQGASWAQEQRTIRLLKTENANRKLGHLLFEIANANQAKEFDQIKKEVDAGDLDKNAYVKRVELVEYKAAKVFTDTIKNCIEKYNWPKDSDMGIPLVFSSKEYNTLEKYWELIKLTKHAKQVAKDWIDNSKDVYCAKHPMSPDCHF